MASCIAHYENQDDTGLVPLKSNNVPDKDTETGFFHTNCYNMFTKAICVNKNRNSRGVSYSERGRVKRSGDLGENYFLNAA